MNTPTILLVDDLSLITNLLTIHFENAGFLVYTASSGNEAIAKLKEKKMDVVLTDTDMSNGDGFDVVRYCDSSNIPVIMMSANYMDSRTPDQQKLAGHRFIHKHVVNKEAVRQVQELLQLAPVQA